jgi:UPF0271 protein
MKKKPKKYILDTSAILTGKPLNFSETKIVTTSGVSDELKPGGRDYNNFQYLIEKGLVVQNPKKDIIKEIEEISNKSGDKNRLSKVDIEILALALELNRNDDYEIIILTDDYSIQNVANLLNITYDTIGQKGITKRFKWDCRCRGCGKKFKDSISICPICGSETKNIVSNKKVINDSCGKE